MRTCAHASRPMVPPQAGNVRRQGPQVHAQPSSSADGRQAIRRASAPACAQQQAQPRPPRLQARRACAFSSCPQLYVKRA